MINKKIETAINKQINAEIYSSSLYYSMAAYFETQSLKGFSHWLRVQALEELTHVQKFFAYVHERGGRIRMLAVDGPVRDEVEWCCRNTDDRPARASILGEVSRA